MPGQSDAYDVTPKGDVLYNANNRDLKEISASGQSKTIWNCTVSNCYSNTVSYDPKSDTVLMSFPYINRVVRIARGSGQVTATWGDNGNWSFQPSGDGLVFNHWAHISDDGTFMVSTHDKRNQRSHRFSEYEIDEGSKTLKRIWSYESTRDFAQERGLVNKVPGGTYIGNYGWAGVIVEVTSDNKVAWRLKNGKMIGNNILLDDLYAINRGPK